MRGDTTCRWASKWGKVDPSVRFRLDAEGNDVVASWNQVRHADLVDQFLFYDDLYNGNLSNSKARGPSPMGWKLGGSRLCASQELAYGLGWAASDLLGMNAEIDRLAASFSDCTTSTQPTTSLGPRWANMSSAAASMVASLGATSDKLVPVQFGSLWSSQSLAGGS